MIKILIVDDEMLIRVGIKSCINWESNGFEIIGLAEDGNEALEIIERERPEIVLTDIKMPNMDGLELIEKIKKRYPTIRVIVLSCYNEIDFIKKAMKLGVDDYILKLSMQPEDLLNILINAKNAMVNDEEELLQLSNNQREIKINKEFMKEDFYKKAIENAISGERLVGELKNIGSKMSFKRLGMICASIDDYSEASIRSRLNDRYLLKFSVINIIEEILSTYFIGDIVEIEKGEFLLILDISEKLDYQETSKEFCLKVNNALESYFNISISFGVSEKTEEVKYLKTIYEEAKKALEQKFYYGRGSVLFYDQKKEFSNEIILLNLQDEKKLLSCLENLDEERAKIIVDRFFSDIENMRKLNPSRVRIAAVEILNSYIKIAKKFEVESDFALVTSENYENPVNFLMRAETIFDIKSWFATINKRFIDCLSNKRLTAERPEILKLKQYISERIYEDITLERAAKITNMSKSYFSSVFKKETGESFTDYVNRLKMEEAKVLIQRYGLKNYETAGKLGFIDESYFSKLFKKYNGISPSKVNK